MSGSGAARMSTDGADGMRVDIIAASWHDEVMNGLIAGAESVVRDAGCDWRLHRVPGAFELPGVAAARARAGVEAIVALGVVIRGGTPHFEYVCDAATSGLARVALDTGVPVGFGLLTCDDEAPALDRAGLAGSREDKGREAAEAAIATALLLRRMRTP